jgi:hypothetical protein
MIEDIGIISQLKNLGEINAKILSFLCFDFSMEMGKKLYVYCHVCFRWIMETPTVRGIPLLELSK